MTLPFLRTNQHLFGCMLLSCNVRVSEWIHTECQGTPCSKQALYLKFKRQQRDAYHVTQEFQWIHTHNTVNHLASLAKWLSVLLQTKWLWGFEARYCHLNITIYLFEFSNINSRIKCEICVKLTIEVPDIFLLSLLLNLNIFDTF